MNKKELHRYKDLNKEIEQLEKSIEELKDLSVKSTVITGMPSSGKLSNPTAEYGEKIAALATRQLVRKVKALDEYEKIEETISALEPLERVLMRERYINGLDWEEICVKLNYSWRQVHRLHSNILTKLADDKNMA